MKKILILLIASLSFLLISPSEALAHRSGCHRWHSCPSDTGSYTCGDTGYCSGCGNNYYCKNGVYSPGWQKKAAAAKQNAKTPAKKEVKIEYFVGKPSTYSQLYSCKIVGNSNSMIYHLKGSSYIKKMTLKNKECFLSEQGAKDKGFRKSKV